MDIKNSRIAITGGSGFLGTNLYLALLACGVPKENITAAGSQSHNLLSGEACGQLCEGSDIVFHLAGYVGGIGRHTQEPATVVHDNIIMNANVIDAAAAKGVGKLVLVGTACSYPEDAPVPLKEEDIWKGYPAKDTAPYGLVKRMMTVQANAYREQYGLSAITLIPTNIYGKHDHFESEAAHVIPALISRIAKAKAIRSRQVQVWGDGTATREFIYAEEVAAALMKAAERDDKPEPGNIGTGEEATIKSVAVLIANLIGYSGWLVWDKSKPTGFRRRQMDITKAEKEFGFRARVPLREGLEKTIEWYNRKCAGEDYGNL